jgi:putative addiction module killer protein
MNVVKIRIYSTDTGKEPYAEWEDRLDKITRAVVKSRLERVKIGNFGNARRIEGGVGVWEFKIDYGPGYRIYFGKKGETIVLLLIGGEKKSQKRDIEKAKQYWSEGKKLL